jgi:putative transposase
MITHEHRQSYPSDLSDQEWEVLKPHLPEPNKRGRPLEYSLREIINALLYILRAGCAWRMMPHDFPPWPTVYSHFRKWRKAGLWEAINAMLRVEVRHSEGREASPSAAIIDSQSVKTTAVKGERGYDAGKQVNGRKRHLIVDTLGLVLCVIVTAASVQDRDGAKQVFQTIQGRFPRLKLIWADGGYRGQLIDWVKTKFNWLLEIVQRNADVAGFQVLPRRWVVERTLGWLGNYRRLSKDYECLTQTSETFIYLASSHIMLRRLARKVAAQPP